MASAAIQAVFAGRAALGASKDLTERRFALGK
jgi:hypothetical protein